jgi:hypothetical protein
MTGGELFAQDIGVKLTEKTPIGKITANKPGRGSRFLAQSGGAVPALSTGLSWGCLRVVTAKNYLIRLDWP